ncbi:MAG: hypothetical protein ACRYFZ_09155 [Janthinobacterium lividum]
MQAVLDDIDAEAVAHRGRYDVEAIPGIARAAGGGFVPAATAQQHQYYRAR